MQKIFVLEDEITKNFERRIRALEEKLDIQKPKKQCTVCGIYYQAIRDRKSKNHYCSTKCANKYNNEVKRQRRLKEKKRKLKKF